MTITINKTDGTVLATVNDGVVDTSATNLALIGRLYRNYGELVNENFVKLLENFANASSPTAPIRGQLWFDTVNRTLKVFRTTGFVSLGSLTASNAQPNNPSIGDLWFDTIDQQLKIYNNTWIVVGPSYTSSQGKTGIFTETVRDTTNGNRLIISSYINNSIASIHSYSSDTWIPQTAISGFTNIQPGINLSNLNNQRFVGIVSSLNTAKYWINFDGRTSNLAIRDSYDIDSLTKTGTNTYTLGLAKPLTSNAICGVGSNGGRISVVPVIGATSITIVTLSETENMGFVIYSA